MVTVPAQYYFKRTREWKCPNVVGRILGKMGREARAGIGMSGREQETVGKVLGCFSLARQQSLNQPPIPAARSFLRVQVTGSWWTAMGAGEGVQKEEAGALMVHFFIIKC